MIRVTALAALLSPALLATPLAAQDPLPAPAAAPLPTESSDSPGGEGDAAQASATETRLTLEQAMLLRCSAAFALVANRQIRGEEWALAYPPLAEQGREFFVQATSRLIDELQISENVLAEVIYAEAGKLGQPNLDQIMPVCLTLLPPEDLG